MGNNAHAYIYIFGKYDFLNKTIIPFCTHEGSRLGKSEDDIKNLCKQTTVLKGLSIHGSDVNNSKELINSWLKNIAVI